VSLPLGAARGIAEGLLAELAPACLRAEIAGSIRRESVAVKDIELVVIPRMREEVPVPAQPDLWAPPPPAVRVSCLWERIEEVSEGHQRIVPIKPGVPSIEPDPRWAEKRLAGSRYFKLRLPSAGVNVDLFMATAENWGLILAIRTGSALFSQALVTRWTEVSRGGHSRGGRLLDARGLPVPAPEERDVFAACQLVWVPPRERVDAGSLRPIPPFPGL
jgi:DNA polymerase/3'-5' exonuclease PolX